MHFLLYFAIATPVVLAWLFWAAETSEPAKPIALLHTASFGLHQDSAMTQRGQDASYPQFPADPETTDATLPAATPKAVGAKPVRPPSRAEALTKVKREVWKARAQAQPGDPVDRQLAESRPVGQDRFSIGNR